MRNAVITGAAGGIGQALVNEFTRAGYRVIGTDRTPQPDGLACAHWLQADLAVTVSEADKADATFAQVRACLSGKGLHALVNNAAIQILGGADSLSRADWRSTLDVNLLAPFFWAQGLLPELEAVHGCVVNISSIHSRLTKPDFVAYATSKAALSGLTRALAVDLRGRVRINAIEPAAVETKMLRAGFEGRPEALTQLEACHPIGRLARPEEIARAAVMLADPAMGFAHGTCLSVDGGIAATLHDPA